jgi:hypothetical protein
MTIGKLKKKEIFREGGGFKNPGESVQSNNLSLFCQYYAP